MPVTRARPPTRQNGTSAPERAATPSRRSRPSAARRRRRPSRRRARRPRGCACRSARRAVRPTARRARAHEVVVAGGHVGPGALERPRGRRRRSNVELVGQVERHHLGVDEVVAVGPHAGDPQRQRQLGRGEHDVGHHGERRRRQPAPVVDASSSARALGARPRRASNAGGVDHGRPATRRSILRRWPNPASHQGEQAARARLRSAAGGSRRSIRDQRRLDPRLGHEHGRRDPARPRAAVGPVADLHRRDAVGAGPGRRRPAARPPRAAPSPACARPRGRRRGGRATSGVATLYGRLATSDHARSPSSAGPVELHGVALDHRGPGRLHHRSAAPAAGGGRPRRR